MTRGVRHSQCHHCCSSWAFLHCFLLLHSCLLLFPKGARLTFNLVSTFPFYHQTYFSVMSISSFRVNPILYWSVPCTFGSTMQWWYIFIHRKIQLYIRVFAVLLVVQLPVSWPTVSAWCTLNFHVKTQYFCLGHH